MAGFATSLGAGLTQGAGMAYQEQKDKPERDLRLRQAMAQVQSAEANAALAPIQKSSAEMQNEILQQQLRQMQGQAVRQQSYDTFRMYDSDGDTRHLNNFLKDVKQNPLGASTFGPVVRFDAIDKTTDGQRMLAESGYTDYEGILGDPELKKNFVVATLQDGTQKLVSMPQVYAGTGYAKMLSDEKLTTMTKQAALMKALQGGNTVKNVSSRERIATQMAQDLGIPVWDAYQRLENKNKSAGSMVERLADQLMEANPEMEYLDAMNEALRMTKSTERERYAEILANSEGTDTLTQLQNIREKESRTSTQKDLAAAGSSRQALDDLAGGDFFAADINDPALRRSASPHIAAIENLMDKKLTTEDKRLAREIRNLTTLGATAGSGLSDAETGPLDYVLKNVKKYLVDEVGGTQATSSYETFRNVLRNALYGASLTKTEAESFTRAAGSLAQQTQPVLSGLRTQMQTLKDQLSSIYDMNDPYVAQYYLGMDVEHVDKAIEALDERLNLIKMYDGAKLIPSKGVVTPDNTERKSLDDIFRR